MICTISKQFLFALLLFTAFCSRAENISSPVSSFMGIKVGYRNIASMDKLYSPFVYAGQSSVFGIGWGKDRGKLSLETDIHFSNTTRTAHSLEGIPRSYEQGHFLLAKNSFLLDVNDYYRFRLTDLHRDLQIYFSGLWFTSVNITTNANGLPELIQSGLAPGIMVRSTPGKHHFRAELHVPLVAWTVRNHYSLSAPQTYEKLSKFDYILRNSLFQTPVSNPALYATFSYGYSFSKKISARAGYNFRYLHNRTPLLLQSVSGVYSISFIYTR